MPPMEARAVETTRQGWRHCQVPPPTFRAALLAFRQIDTSQVSSKVDLTGESALVLRHVERSAAFWIKKLNPRLPKAPVRFSLPKLP